MANLRQAPKLYHTGKKHQGNFYQLPQDLMDIVFDKLDGKCGNQIKLMCVLLGTQGNGTFGVSEKWICDRTGMVQQTYNKARKALIDRGWLKQEDGKLFVLISFIYAEGTTSDCVENKATISEFEGTTSEYQAQSEIVSEAQYDVVHNIKGIKKDNKKEIDMCSFSANAEKEIVSGESERENVVPVAGAQRAGEAPAFSSAKDVFEEFDIPEWGRKSDWEYVKSFPASRYMGDALGF